MPDLHINDAFVFYKKFILDVSRSKAEVYRHYGFKLEGSVGSKDWEVFAAILLDDRARHGDGADLVMHEVKSAIIGGSFEYQYHRNHGLAKLKGDQEVNHVYISRSQKYEDITVYYLEREQIRPLLSQWLPALEENYAIQGRQRFRRSISSGFVRQQGILLLEIHNGELVFK